MDQPTLLERDSSSLLLCWRSKLTTKSNQVFNLEISENDRVDWKTLSSTLRSTTIRKKNLVLDHQYYFRVRSKEEGDNSDWSEFSQSSEPFSVLPQSIKQLYPPNLKSRDSQSLTITWAGVEKPCEGYKLRYRAETESTWQYIESMLKDNIVKKKGLLSGLNYYFAVCPVGCSDEYEYSLSSPSLQVEAFSKYLRDLLPSTLLASNNTTVSTESVLAGKTIAIYFSAHWCGPCRQFTPKLSASYKQLKLANKPLEVIFCSADHNESDFNGYFKDMPFLAIPYDDDKRENFMGLFKVSSIPRLVVLAPSGRIIIDNAAGQDISMSTIDNWIAQGAKL